LAQEFKRTGRTTTVSKYDFIESAIGKRKRMNYMSEEELTACVRKIGREKSVVDQTMKEFIQEQWEKGKSGFGCTTDDDSYEEAVQACEELGIEYEAEADTPGDVWFEFKR
jgi:hypothetical protein